MKNNIKNLKVRVGAMIIAASSMFSLCGCDETELAPEEEYDIVIQTQNGDNSLSMGLTQTLDVPGQEFKLITEYACDDTSKREWRVTSDKFLYFNVHTEGLSNDIEVYIDNIHIDTSIKSKYASVDGIIQDSMDDHVHSSRLIGFPISDTTMYYGVNAIEGCNQDFITGTFYGYNGYNNGEVLQKRYTESDYIELGVYANKIQIVYDLLVKGKNDKSFYNVSVSTDFLVPISSAQINYDENEDAYQKIK